MKKVDRKEVPKVREEHKKNSGGSDLAAVKNVVNEIAERFTKYEPILDELDRYRIAKEEGQKQISETAGANQPPAANPRPQFNIPPELLQMVTGYLAPPNPLNDLMMQSLKEDIAFTRMMKNGIAQKMFGKTLDEMAGAIAK